MVPQTRYSSQFRAYNDVVYGCGGYLLTIFSKVRSWMVKNDSQIVPLKNQNLG